MKKIMQGLGACEGIGQGKTKIIKDLDEIKNIEREVILVMEYFSPLYTIHLSKVKGILIDFGGKTCHGAIIAREFGIPCIVNLKNSTKKLKNNQTITINGKTGEVYEIES